MDENPYESSKVIVRGGTGRSALLRLRSARWVIALLLTVVAFQWVCHFFTAAVMFEYIRIANYGPTAKALDSAFYGLCCVSVTAIASIIAGAVGARALVRRDATSEGEQNGQCWLTAYGKRPTSKQP